VSRKLTFYSGLVLLVCLASCRATRPTAVPVVVTATAEDYINKYKDLAVSEVKRTGVPASITLAQGMLESDYGRSSLSRLANNHFGIKCHNDWTGQTVRQPDEKHNECFRKYKRPEDSFYDHSDFLKSTSRYSFLFDLDPSNYKAWAHGLKKAGYATNPEYASLLIRKIEENNLTAYDHGYTASVAKRLEKAQAQQPHETSRIRNAEQTPAGEESVTFGAVMARVPRIMENNRIQYIIVKDGDTREKIEDEFQLLKWELPRYNELAENFKPVPGQMLYLQPKREKAETGKEFHTTASGETMYDISQKYGVKLGSLLEMNRMAKDSVPSEGQQIWLQTIKPLN
jgi:flagellum-specific peptidoglycan hydrolase FlgJ/LysM repeat protein